jgi:hypothetical protein
MAQIGKVGRGHTRMRVGIAPMLSICPPDCQLGRDPFDPPFWGAPERTLTAPCARVTDGLAVAGPRPWGARNTLLAAAARAPAQAAAWLGSPSTS